MITSVITLYILPVVIFWVLWREYFAYQNRKKSLKGRVVLVTGSANGFGRENCLAFAREQCHIICVDIDETNNKETVKQCKEIANGIKVIDYTCDISDPKNVQDLSKNVYAQFEHVDILFNNAGVAYAAPLSTLTESQIKRLFDVNVLAHFWMVRTFLPKMIERKRGLIVATSSIAGRLGVESLAPYCASKFAVTGFMDSLKNELNVLNCKVRTLTIHPGFMATTLMPKLFRNPGIVWLKPYKPLHISSASDVAKEVIIAIKEKKTRIYCPNYNIILVNLIKYCFPQFIGDWIFCNILTINEYIDPL